MSSSTEEVASLRQKLSDVESDKLDLQKKVLRTCTRWRETIDELSAENLTLRSELNTAKPIAKETKIGDLEDPPSERNQNIQGELRSARDKIGELQSYISELEDNFQSSLDTIEVYQSENRALESELDTLHEQNDGIVKRHNKLVDDEVEYGHGVRKAYFSWDAGQEQRNLQHIPPSVRGPPMIGALRQAAPHLTKPARFGTLGALTLQQHSSGQVSRGASRALQSGRRDGTPATRPISRGIRSLVSGDLSGRLINSGQRDVTTGSVSSLEPPQLTPKNTAKPYSLTARDKADGEKQPSYTSKLREQRPNVPFPPRKVDNAMRLQAAANATLSNPWSNFVDSDSDSDIGPKPAEISSEPASDADLELAKISPPASHAALVADQSSTTHVRHSKRQRLS